MPTTAKEGQSLVDLCMQATGTAESLFFAAVLNGLSITDNPDLNTVLSMPEAVSEKAVKLFVKLPPASDSDDINDSSGSGIGFAVNANRPLEKLTQKVAEGQSLVDLCMQETGISSNLFDMAVLNGISITEALNVDDLVKTQDVVLKQVAKQFAKHKPASDDNEDGPPLTPKQEGIDFWFVWECVVQ